MYRRWNSDTKRPELIQRGREKLNRVGWLDTRNIDDDLVDGYVKALRRRAGQEKWVEAGRDWGFLAVVDWKRN